MTRGTLDLDRLLKLRLIVARFGELDIARWWNTRGQLGRLGMIAVARGFPRTHSFAQARSVFAVATHRCTEIFDPPDIATLWHMPQAIEDEFESRWEHWLDQAADWHSFFEMIENIEGHNLAAAVQALVGVSKQELEKSSRLRRSSLGSAVPLPDTFSGTDQDVTLLALGFARGEVGSLVVPYARRSAE